MVSEYGKMVPICEILFLFKVDDQLKNKSNYLKKERVKKTFIKDVFVLLFINMYVVKKGESLHEHNVIIIILKM